MIFVVRAKVPSATQASVTGLAWFKIWEGWFLHNLYLYEDSKYMLSLQTVSPRMANGLLIAWSPAKARYHSKYQAVSQPEVRLFYPIFDDSNRDD
jgi:hypothetical protein